MQTKIAIILLSNCNTEIEKLDSVNLFRNRFFWPRVKLLQFFNRATYDFFQMTNRRSPGYINYVFYIILHLIYKSYLLLLKTKDKINLFKSFKKVTYYAFKTDQNVFFVDLTPNFRYRPAYHQPMLHLYLQVIHLAHQKI